MEVEKGEIITLSDGIEYVCLSIILSEDNKKYLYLMSTSKPLKICFAEETILGDAIQMRIVGDKDENRKIFNLLKAQVQNNSNRDL